jgi:sec-independent protein translocase protein TatA
MKSRRTLSPAFFVYRKHQLLVTSPCSFIIEQMQNQILLFFNLGGGELIVIMLVILLFFGSKRIPELAKGLGKGMREMKDAMNGIQSDIESSVNEVKQPVADATKTVQQELKEFENPDISDIPSNSVENKD